MANTKQVILWSPLEDHDHNGPYIVVTAAPLSMTYSI